MKLLSMIDFVLWQQEIKPDYANGESFSDSQPFKLGRIYRYARFLKQPLKLEYFVPCGNEGNVLEECKYLYDLWKNMNPEEKNIYKNRCDEYEKAREKVLFEGFEAKKRANHYIVKDSKTNGPVFLSWNDSKKVENLLSYDLDVTLTPSAIKQLGL